jgi:hypothetical protein
MGNSAIEQAQPRVLARPEWKPPAGLSTGRHHRTRRLPFPRRRSSTTPHRAIPLQHLGTLRSRPFAKVSVNSARSAELPLASRAVGQHQRVRG